MAENFGGFHRFCSILENWYPLILIPEGECAMNLSLESCC